MTIVQVPLQPQLCRNFAGGQWRETQAVVPLVSPYNNQVIGQVADSTAADVDTVVSQAVAAFPGWRDTPIKERAAILLRYRELLLTHLRDLSHLVAAESGKTYGEAEAGLMKGVEVLEFAISLQNILTGSKMDVSRGVTCEERWEPLGVVAGITPFNFPAMVPMWMFPIAIALGNCFVLKPSEKAALTPGRLAQIFADAGLPSGVFSIVNGGKTAVECLIDHPQIKAVGFVGSTAVAREVYTRASRLQKRALTLGGAKNFMIVTPDADPDVTVPGVTASFTGCAGQRCMAGSILVAVGPVDQMIDKIIAKARSLNLGNDMGAIIDRKSHARITGIIDQAVKQGAVLRLDGRSTPAPTSYIDGNWMGPTVLDQVQTGWECYETEIFGPVLSIIRVSSLSDAMRLEKESRYGNATSVFTTSGAVAQYVAQHASNGMVGINIGVPVPREPFSFGGSKDSKFGQGDITGPSSIYFWSQIKKITTKWSIEKDQNWMS